MTRSGRPTPCRGTWGCTRESPADVRIRSNTHVHPSRSGALLRQSRPNSANAECPPPPSSTPLRDSRSFVRPFVRFLPALCDPRFAPSPLFSPHVTTSQPATAKSRQPCTDAHSNVLDTLCFALCHGSDSRRSPSLPFLVSSALMLPDVKGRATIDKGSCRLPPFWSSPARPSAHPMCPPPPNASHNSGRAQTRLVGEAGGEGRDEKGACMSSRPGRGVID